MSVAFAEATATALCDRIGAWFSSLVSADTIKTLKLKLDARSSIK
jgi:hypothetical protein